MQYEFQEAWPTSRRRSSKVWQDPWDDPVLVRQGLGSNAQRPVWWNSVSKHIISTHIGISSSDSTMLEYVKRFCHLLDMAPDMVLANVLAFSGATCRRPILAMPSRRCLGCCQDWTARWSLIPEPCPIPQKHPSAAELWEQYPILPWSSSLEEVDLPRKPWKTGTCCCSGKMMTGKM